MGTLEQMFTGHSTESFLARHWPDQHLVCHGAPERLGPLIELPEFSGLAVLLGSYRDQVRVALPDKRDEHSSLKVDGVTAAALHGSGMALILNGVERFLPLVSDWLNALRLELGLPPGCEPRSIVYVTPSGAGNSPHFDANANFVMQLRGTKRWHLAPNTHVPHPTDRWAMNEATTSEELRGYVTGPLPTTMPGDAEVIDLHPGSVLFVPRGYWHATESDEDTLSLNFTFGQPTWADVVLSALRRKLLRHDSWRQLARASEPELTEKLAALHAEVLTTSEVNSAFEEPAAAYLLAPDAFLSVEEGQALASLDSEELVLELGEHLHPVLEWLAEQGGPFSVAEAAQLFPEVASELNTMFEALAAKGLLTRATNAGRPGMMGP